VVGDPENNVVDMVNTGDEACMDYMDYMDYIENMSSLQNSSVNNSLYYYYSQ
jgi:hypothetical protein